MIRLVVLAGALSLSAHATAAPAVTLVTEEFAPYSYADHGKVRGYSTELVEAALEQAGIDYGVRIYPWARAFLMARTQPNVLIYSIVRTPTREAQFQWIAPIAPRSVYFYKRKSRQDILLRSVEDLRRYRVGANRGDVVEEQLRQLGLVAELSAQNEFNLRKLVVGRLDLMVATDLSLRDLCARTQIRCDELERTMPLPGMGDYYVAASLRTPAATVEALRTELDKLKSSGEAQRLADKYGLTLK
ncbi:transporter substrate-binding domain-containing protein [Pseudoduganella sp. FT55W]|uniref:Transporter substrate-binding domain-containing protein n=1 Tax=Duganella rivi TaxID=2666083 RepID=A0A7X4KCC2_9BURK|nr:transporter substrate-binding domain-containing protein [Duganella rivi]MYM68050.1 transporter substrate-binding domain-containing protein [Duganella rivi]